MRFLKNLFLSVSLFLAIQITLDACRIYPPSDPLSITSAQPDNESQTFSKRVLPNLFPSNSTASNILIHDTSSVQIDCHIINNGPALFDPSTGNKYHFIRIVLYDLETDQFWEYWKDYFLSTIAPGDSDIYYEDINTFGLGRKAIMICVNDNKQYPETFYNDNTLFFGIRTVSDPVCGGCSFGYKDNSFINQDIKNKLKKY